MKPLTTIQIIHPKRFPKLPGNRKVRGRHLFVALVIGLAAFLLHNGFSGRHEESQSLTNIPLDYPDFFAMSAEHLERFSTIKYTVHQSETLRQIFQRHGLPGDSFSDWGKSCPGFNQAGQLQPGDGVSIKLAAGRQEPIGFTVAAAEGATYAFLKGASGWECNETSLPLARITEALGGAVSDFPYDAFVRAGMATELITELADIFACTIDFNVEFQKGDTFAVHFEEQVRDGKRVRIGPVLAAEINNGGRRLQAFLYQLQDGTREYFDSEGKSLARTFLRSPLGFGRLSSSSRSRGLQPIQRVLQPQPGIDYSAPQGTPVLALGEGVVTFTGHRRGQGRCIEMRHGTEFTTTYGRLSSVTKGLKPGSKVGRGDIIGHVGSMGTGTASRLDFRFYRNGRPQDFLIAQFPSLHSVPQSLRADFDKKREAYQVILRSSLTEVPATISSTAAGNE